MERRSSDGGGGAARRAAILATAVVLSGCVTGFVRVRTPERLPPESLPPLTERVSFDVCMGRPTPREYDRALLGARIRTVLARGGVQADLVARPGAAARFTVTERQPRSEYGWIYGISAWTFSIMPGYLVERTTLEVNLAPPPVQRERLTYERQMEHFVWLPFVVHPDFGGVVGSPWTSARYDDGGLEDTILRLADDLRVRLGGAGEGAPGAEARAVACPRWIPPR